jgi:hypothetical protein
VQPATILYSREDHKGTKRRDLSMYAMITRWTFKSGSIDEAIDVNRDVVMPAVQAQPGFVRSLIVRTGTESVLSVVCWETEEDAKRAMTDVAPIAIRHIGYLVRDVERVPGTVVYDVGADVPAPSADPDLPLASLG